MRTFPSALTALLCLGVWHTTKAQCVQNFSLGPDTTICEGNSLLLSAAPGFQSYLWSTGSIATAITVSTPDTYICTVTDFGTSGELVTNGNFTQGASGFSSDYVPGYGGTYGLLSGSGTYATSTNPSSTHVNFYSFGDHTTGFGQMLVVNGAEVPGQNIWCQTVAVQPNTDYAFSAWLATAYPESPAQLVFTINGVTIGNPLLAPFATGQWLNFYSIWNSEGSTSATLCISNQNAANSGNDFTLDDISFAPFCTYTDEIEVNVQTYPQPDLGDAVEVCDDVAVMLDATTPNADVYAWQNGATTASLIPPGSGIYWVDVTENGCTARDSVIVLFDPLPTVELGPDQEQCEGDPVVLNAFFPGATYLWQDGTTQATLAVNSSGSYGVTLDLGGCIATDAVAFVYHPLPNLDLGPDTLICADTLLFLNVERPGGSYQWENGENTAQRIVVDPGIYWVRVTELGCSTTDSLALGVIPLPFVDLGPDFLLCIGQTKLIDAGGPGFSYLWNSGDTTSQYRVTEEGVVQVTVSNVCAVVTDSLLVTEDLCDCPVFVPNAFTANGDEENDGFKPIFDCPVDAYVFRVFNRWGGLIWESEDPAESWDGGGGDPDGTEIGVYSWLLEIRPRTVNENSLHKLFGHVVLLR